MQKFKEKLEKFLLNQNLRMLIYFYGWLNIDLPEIIVVGSYFVRVSEWKDWRTIVLSNLGRTLSWASIIRPCLINSNSKITSHLLISNLKKLIRWNYSFFFNILHYYYRHVKFFECVLKLVKDKVRHIVVY